MKMLVSDYDNTFYLNDEDIKNNVKLVNEFMKNNIFLIATGRSYFHYDIVKNKYNINSNYLIINHGATIIKNDKIIYNIEINNDIKNKLIQELKLDKAVDIFCCSLIENYTSLDNYNLTKIHIKYKTKAIAKEINELIINKYSKYLNCFFVCENQAIEIVSKEADKSKAINFIANLESIQTKDIYVIGDSYTDIEMIKKFNGFRMTNCVEELKQITNNEYESVSILIGEILNDKV